MDNGYTERGRELANLYREAMFSGDGFRMAFGGLFAIRLMELAASVGEIPESDLELITDIQREFADSIGKLEEFDAYSSSLRV